MTADLRTTSRRNTVRRLLVRDPSQNVKVLSAKLGVSVRTIARDIAAIREAALAEIDPLTTQQHAAEGIEFYTELAREAWNNYSIAKTTEDNRRNISMAIWFDKLVIAREGMDKLFERVGIYQTGQVNINIIQQQINKLPEAQQRALDEDRFRAHLALLRDAGWTIEPPVTIDYEED